MVVAPVALLAFGGPPLLAGAAEEREKATSRAREAAQTVRGDMTEGPGE